MYPRLGARWGRGRTSVGQRLAGQLPEPACPDCKADQSLDFEYYQRQPGGDWTLSTEAAFQAAGETADSTQVFVHGNRIEGCEAFSRGARVYQALTRHASYAGPIRFVIWSWPSSEICGPRRDARVKASRTYAASYHLGVLLARLPQDEPLGMIGFSFGGRIVCGALHLMAGGSLCGWTLPEPGPFTLNARVALLASASHNGWLIPGQLHGRCWECIDQMMNYYNPRDPVLRLYPKLERWSRPRALGYIGICERQLGQAAERFDQVNVSSVIGCSHDLGRYLSSCGVMDVVAPRLLWLD